MLDGEVAIQYFVQATHSSECAVWCTVHGDRMIAVTAGKRIWKWFSK